MRIIGFNLKNMSIERAKDITDKVEIKTNMEITEIKKENLDIAGEILKFQFIYKIFYNPDSAKIHFEGTVLAKPDKNDDLKKIMKEWKNKKVNDDLRVLIYNFILMKCNLKAIQLEDEFSLPPHIPLPRLTKGKKEQDPSYAG